MREPTKEEMIEGIALGVKKFLEAENSTLAAQGSGGVLSYLSRKFEHSVRDGVAIAMENAVMKERDRYKEALEVISGGLRVAAENPWEVLTARNALEGK